MNAKLTHVLLVEDDLTTAHFLQAALQPLPAMVDWARSCSQALHCARSKAHDLWLIDLNLPDGTGVELLSQLRALHRHMPIPALAHTAELNSEIKPALQHAGFVEILIKPFSMHALRSAVQGALQQQMNARWDEAAALKALGGQGRHLHILRQIFLAELPATRDAVYQALKQGNQAMLRGHLHRLKASCGFVGAVQLAQAVRQLQQHPHSHIARQQFDAATSALLC